VPHPLTDFRLKLNRADEHLETLRQDIDDWFARRPYGVIGQYQPGPPEQYVLGLRFFEPIPRQWGVLIGEFAHNARSALDYLAWQLVLMNGGRPDHWTQFPIVFTPWDWHGRHGAARLRGASARHIGMVEAVQPFGRPHDDGFYWLSMHELMNHPLAVLRFLSNEDKHRVLIPTAAALEAIGWDVTGLRDVEPVADLGSPFLGALEDGSPLLTIPVKAAAKTPSWRSSSLSGLA
jgi:hypothetical protein